MPWHAWECEKTAFHVVSHPLLCWTQDLITIAYDKACAHGFLEILPSLSLILLSRFWDHRCVLLCLFWGVGGVLGIQTQVFMLACAVSALLTKSSTQPYFLKTHVIQFFCHC